jgi:hypothetical protein
VFDHETFVSGLTETYGLRQRIWPGQSTAPVPLLVLQTLRIELGWALLLFAPLAAAVCLVRRGVRARATVLALSVVLALLLYHSSQPLFMERFLLPCTPFLALICAWGLVALVEGPRAAWARHPAALWVGVVAVLIVAPLGRSVYFDVILQRSDTRLLAKAYLDRVAPPGSVIVRQTESLYAPPVDPRRYRLLFLKLNRALLDPDRGAADFYVFNSFDLGQVPGVSEGDERLLMAALEQLGFSRMTFSPLRDGGDLWVERALSFRSYRHLFRYERPGPAIVIYARPGMSKTSVLSQKSDEYLCTRSDPFLPPLPRGREGILLREFLTQDLVLWQGEAQADMLVRPERLRRGCEPQVLEVR